MPVLAAFMVSKILPMKWNFCQNSGSGRTRLVTMECRLNCFGNDLFVCVVFVNWPIQPIMFNKMHNNPSILFISWGKKDTTQLKTKKYNHICSCNLTKISFNSFSCNLNQIVQLFHFFIFLLQAQRNKNNWSNVGVIFSLSACTKKDPQATSKTLHTTLFTQLIICLSILWTCKVILACYCLEIAWSKLHFCWLEWNCIALVAW